MKDLLNIDVPANTKITVIGDIHEHEKQFDDLVQKIQPSPENILISVGDIYDKGFGTPAAESITRKIRALFEKNIAYIVQGNHEVKNIRRAIVGGASLSPELQWLALQPLSLSLKFKNGYRITIVHGGVLPKHTWTDLNGNSDLVYVRTVDENGDYIPLRWVVDNNGNKKLEPKKIGKTWHELYDGRFGYMVSGHDAQKDGIAKFYKHSCNLDSGCYVTGILTAQVFGENGREETIKVHGPAANIVKI